ncbi:MAG: LPP20 family lipoprotein, partial [Candidatus Cloacimonetes bacterium]|nr:LPP20 family lipoprotein [Candidatus Cloacimonadota bacterium]
MKTKILLIVLLTFSITLFSIPKWYTNNFADKYPDYFIGKGSAVIVDGNIAAAETQAKNLALKDAASIISCQVSGETINRVSEEELEENTKVTEYFLSEAKVKTDLEVMNYKILKKEKDGKMYYVMIGIPAADMKNS